MKPAPCPQWRKPHWENRSDVETALRNVGLLRADGKNSPADVHRCEACRAWTYTLRPSEGDAA